MTSEPVDFSSELPDETAVLDVLGKTGKKTGWQVTFAGPSHPKTVASTNEAARDALRKSAQVEAAQINGRKYKPEEKDLDEVRKSNVKWVVSRIVTWTPVKVGEKTYEFSDEAATELLMKPEMGATFVQFVDYLADERSFTKDSAKT